MQIMVPGKLSIHELRSADRLTWPRWAQSILFLRDVRPAIFYPSVLALLPVWMLAATLPNPWLRQELRIWIGIAVGGALFTRAVQSMRLRRRLLALAPQQNITVLFTSEAIVSQQNGRRGTIAWSGFVNARIDDQVLVLASNLRTNRRAGAVMIFAVRTLTPAARRGLYYILAKQFGSENVTSVEQ